MVEKIIEADSPKIILIIPRFSHLAESLSNFHLLKREADALDKEIYIESVDDRVVELASISGFKAVNPFFAKNKRRFSDIVGPVKKSSSRRTPPIKDFLADSDENISAEKFFDRQEKLMILGEGAPSRPRGENRFKKFKKYIPKIPDFNRFYFSWKTFLALAGTAAALWFAIFKLPSAEITVHAKTASWSYKDAILTDQSARLDSKALAIPNQIFIQKKNLEAKFLATGKKQVERKAAGAMIIYNSYSSDPQPLVANTRFLSPEGKIFRLVKSITVPGAKISEGKINPSSIGADVIADQPGSDYNIGPTKLFNIPGFKGTAKYQSFYGESREAMSGGFIGEVAYPTAGDISAAKKELAEKLKDGLKTAIFSQIPSEFKILPDAVSASITKQTVKEETDSENKFSIFAEGEIKAVGFREEDALKVLIARAQDEKGRDFEVVSRQLNYGTVRIDFSSGKMSFLVDFKTDLRHKVDADDLRGRIAGKSESELRAIIFSLPGADSADILLWPFWVNKVPSKLSKITIKIKPELAGQ